jgi:outer membrane protein assembly factor BamB
MEADKVIRTSAVVALLGLLVVSACSKPELILPGERFDVRADLGDSIPVAGQPAPSGSGVVQNRSEPVSLPAQTTNADWTQRSGNARHIPPHGALSAQPVRVFSVTIGTGNSRKNRISAAPIVAGGRVFTLDATATLAATTTGGAPLWATDLTPATDKASEISGGGLAFGAGKVFAATGFGELIAVDPASGTVIWRQRLGSPVTGAPAVEGNTVFVVGRDSSGWAVNTEDGRVLWTLAGAPSGAGVIGSSAPAITDRAVLMPMGSGELVAALKGSGVKIWGAFVAGQRLGRGYAEVADITGDPVVVGDTTFVGNSSGQTLALSTGTGEVIWSAPDGALGPVLPVGGSLFLVNDESRLGRLNAATGEQIWSVSLPFFVDPTPKKRKAITAHYGPLLAGGRIVVASGDGLLRMFNPADGSLVATAEIPGGATTQMALAGGLLYVVGANGQLHAFR